MPEERGLLWADFVDTALAVGRALDMLQKVLLLIIWADKARRRIRAGRLS
ncbi:hypothetical protein ACWEO2_27010 [Nocardia sp. NPDC004278]